MTKLYKKSELAFALVWIAIYVIGGGLCEEISRQIGIESLAPAVFFVAICALLYVWVRKNRLCEEFGLCGSEAEAKAFIWYIPLLLITVSNIGFGVTLKYDAVGTVSFIIKMLCVGFLEELIFRGFLFKAMCRDSVKAAVIVSSVTFGIGHIINLFNGSGMELWENVIQVVAAIAFGFLYVVIFHRGGSLIPCILSHGIFNSMSAFSVWGSTTATVIHTVVVCALVIAYTLVLLKTLPRVKDTSKANS